MKLPENIKWGPPRLQQWCDSVTSAIAALRPLPGKNTTITEDPGGKGVAINAEAGGAATTAATTQPFELIDVSVAPASILRVKYSTLAGLAPTGFVPGDSPVFSITVTTAGYVYGKITFDPTTGAVSGRTIANAATVPADTTTAYHVEIGSYTISDGVLLLANGRFGPIVGAACQNIYVTPSTYTYAFA